MTLKPQCHFHESILDTKMVARARCGLALGLAAYRRCRLHSGPICACQTAARDCAARDCAATVIAPVLPAESNLLKTKKF